MTSLLDARTRSTLSDDEVWQWSAAGSATSGYLSEADIRSYGIGFLWPSAAREVQHRLMSESPAPRLLEPLLTLSDGWDGHGALAPTERALGMAGRFLGSLPESIPGPEVMASVSGGVLMEWESQDVDMLLEILANGQVVVFLRTLDGEVEGPLAVHKDAAAEALHSLSFGAS